MFSYPQFTIIIKEAPPLTKKPLTRKPLTAKPLTVKPLTRKPLTRKEQQSNNNSINTKYNINTISNKGCL